MKRFLATVMALVLLTLSATAMAASMPVGIPVAMPAAGLALTLPEEYINIGQQAAFSRGYIGSEMLVGLTPLPYSDLATFQSTRMPPAFASMKEVTIGGRQFWWFTPGQEAGIAAILVCQEGTDGLLLEIAFYPSDMSQTARNEAIICAIAETVHSRNDALLKDVTDNWVARFQHESIGLGVKLPPSIMKMPTTAHAADEIALYQNEYITLSTFGYEATMDEYAAHWEMTSADYHIQDMQVNGVNCRLYESKDPYSDPALAYFIAQGQDGLLLELVFSASDVTEENENWYYIQQICSTISANP